MSGWMPTIRLDLHHRNSGYVPPGQIPGKPVIRRFYIWDFHTSGFEIRKGSTSNLTLPNLARFET